MIQGCLVAICSVGLVLLGLLILGQCSADDEEEWPPCISRWDGSHRGVTLALKRSLHDPGSYEHVDTSRRGNTWTMRYRAKNAFGALMLGCVTFEGSAHDKRCRVTNFREC